MQPSEEQVADMVRLMKETFIAQSWSLPITDGILTTAEEKYRIALLGDELVKNGYDKQYADHFWSALRMTEEQSHMKVTMQTDKPCSSSSLVSVPPSGALTAIRGPHLQQGGRRALPAQPPISQEQFQLAVSLANNMFKEQKGVHRQSSLHFLQMLLKGMAVPNEFIRTVTSPPPPQPVEEARVKHPKAPSSTPSRSSSLVIHTGHTSEVQSRDGLKTPQTAVTTEILQDIASSGASLAQSLHHNVPPPVDQRTPTTHSNTSSVHEPPILSPHEACSPSFSSSLGQRSSSALSLPPVLSPHLPEGSNTESSRVSHIPSPARSFFPHSIPFPHGSQLFPPQSFPNMPPGFAAEFMKQVFAQTQLQQCALSDAPTLDGVNTHKNPCGLQPNPPALPRQMEKQSSRAIPTGIHNIWNISGPYTIVFDPNHLPSNDEILNSILPPLNYDLFNPEFWSDTNSPDGLMRSLYRADPEMNNGKTTHLQYITWCVIAKQKMIDLGFITPDTVVLFPRGTMAIPNLLVGGIPQWAKQKQDVFRVPSLPARVLSENDEERPRKRKEGGSKHSPFKKIRRNDGSPPPYI